MTPEREQLIDQNYSIETNKFFYKAPLGTVLLLGGNSDIAKELQTRFDKDHWQVSSWSRESAEVPQVSWDLVVCCLGVLDPIGKFFDTDVEEWERNVDSNALLPLRLLRQVWKNHRPGASICFFSGAGTGRPAQTYSGYAASKFLLFKMTELLDDEYGDIKCFILGPGMIKTKIQQQTLAAKDRAMNYERVWKFMTDGDELHGNGTSHDRIYQCLRWCMEQPKDVVGGRNIYVPLDNCGDDMAIQLRAEPSLFKLRRFGDGRKFA